MGGDFPVPRSEGSDLAMTLVDGEEEIPLMLHRRGFKWHRNMWRLREIMGPGRLLEWRFHNVCLFAVRARDVTDALLDAAGRGTTLFEKA
jgi:hypothetical protein